MSRRYWRSIGFQALILLTMAIVAAIDSDIYVAIVSITLLVLPPVNWSVASVLIWTSRQDPSVRSLADSADNALTWAINSTVAALVGILVLGRTMGLISFPLGTILAVMIGFIVVTSSLPAFRFLQTWREVWLPMVRDQTPAPGLPRDEDIPVPPPQ